MGLAGRACNWKQGEWVVLVIAVVAWQQSKRMTPVQSRRSGAGEVGQHPASHKLPDLSFAATLV